jgi:hypothetical protein
VGGGRAGMRRARLRRERESMGEKREGGREREEGEESIGRRRLGTGRRARVRVEGGWAPSGPARVRFSFFLF